MSTRLGTILTTSATLAALLVAPAAVQAAAPSDGARAGEGCRRTLTSYRVLEPGDHGRAVRTLQCTLNDLRRHPIAVDGDYGRQTRRAVHRIESHFEGDGPEHPGRLTHGFWTLLFGVQVPDRELHRGNHGHGVRVLQRALRAAGGDLVVDGSFGAQTRSVLRSYQRHLGHRPTGRLDESTRFMLSQGATF